MYWGDSVKQFSLCHSIDSIIGGYSKPWAIAGGWAIDLFIGTQTRAHEDIEIVTFRGDQQLLQTYLNDWTLIKVRNGKEEKWEPGENLGLPIHEIHAFNKVQKFEILLNESNKEYWIFRRDNRIKRPLEKIFKKTQGGIPYLSPEIALLYKSKNLRDKDNIDFKNSHELLDQEANEWLKNSLITLYGSHKWIENL